MGSILNVTPALHMSPLIFPVSYPRHTEMLSQGQRVPQFPKSQLQIPSDIEHPQFMCMPIQQIANLSVTDTSCVHIHLYPHPICNMIHAS